MEITEWIRHRAASGQALNLHEVARERPELIEQAYALPSPRGWRRCLIDAGVDPYSIIHIHEEVVECVICGYTAAVLGTHLKRCHQMTSAEYREEHGSHCEVSSESYRAGKFAARQVAGIAHWERLWSKHYVIDWIIRLREAGHDLNFHSIQLAGQSLAAAGWHLFPSWDEALRAAGFNPREERAMPPHQQWDLEMLRARLHDFAVAKRANLRLEMPNDLRTAATRLCGTLETAAKTAGLEPEDISVRALFTGDKVDDLVADIRALDNLKGRERRQKLAAIYHGNPGNKRIIQSHFLSLKRLAAATGINPRTVSAECYRDEADVHHDLDLLEREGKTLCFDTLRRGYKRLYNVIRETGWGIERLKNRPQP
jgi:hypothetical protein